MATDTTRNMIHQHTSNEDWVSEPMCYELKPLELGKRTNFCIGVNIRELNKVPSTK